MKAEIKHGVLNLELESDIEKVWITYVRTMKNYGRHSVCIDGVVFDLKEAEIE